MRCLNSLVALFFLIVITLSCDKFDHDPYEKDKENHRFFRCKVDGKEWHNDMYPNFYPGNLSGMYFNQDKGGIEINIYNWPDKEEKEENIFIRITEGIKIGENIMNLEHRNKAYYDIHLPKPFRAYELDTTYNNNIVNITDIDTSNHIIAGTFEFRVWDEDTEEKILIEDGEFDWEVLQWEDTYTYKKQQHVFLRCELNGKEWTPDYYPLSWFNLPLSRLDITSKKGTDYWGQEIMHLFYGGDLNLGENRINMDTVPIYYLKEEKINYFLDTKYDNILNIEKIDSSEHIIIGSFQFRGIIENSSPFIYDTVIVKDGEFDLKMDNWYE